MRNIAMESIGLPPHHRCARVLNYVLELGRRVLEVVEGVGEVDRGEEEVLVVDPPVSGAAILFWYRCCCC